MDTPHTYGSGDRFLDNGNRCTGYSDNSLGDSGFGHCHGLGSGKGSGGGYATSVVNDGNGVGYALGSGTAALEGVA